MKTSSFSPYFKFSKSQRNGIFVLLTAIVVFQMLYFFVDFKTKPLQTEDKRQQWMDLQTPIDSLQREKKVQIPKIYPFNPNFITDFKGYKLGMSVAEIDRLLAYRQTNRYVNSGEEFQKVTGVSDSLLRSMSPYFKFPDWVKNKSKFKSFPNTRLESKQVKAILDLNLATQEDLKKVYGIGDGLSERILKEKTKFGAFVSMEQLKDIWGLSPEVVESLNKDFKIATIPDVKKININSASVKELMNFPYFRYALAKSIVTFRSMNGEIKNTEDLIKISGFPVDKIKIIALYLEF
ncbi:MAG: helix-hairpin-helix domain-containing protein [Burkholderiales bacterium]|nr:helix-hairpin-helix domain-containing protein [Flavobacterium sp.]